MRVSSGLQSLCRAAYPACAPQVGKFPTCNRQLTPCRRALFSCSPPISPLCATGSFASMDCAGNARLHTKIDFLDLFVALKVGRLALDGDATGLQNVSIVGDAERKRDRLLGEQ